jgi:2-dehydro-3-deoxy-phosphogluconate/2-dehydro-3-deoxy-6-phosphogalactonate aldolase
VSVAQIVAPLVTPFVGGRVSTQKLERHARVLLSNRVDVIWLCGSTGLGPSLSADERQAMVQALSFAADRLILQVGSLNLAESLELAALAKRLGVRFISAYPPFYYPRIPEAWVVRYYTQLSRVHPLIVYNYPAATGFDVTPSIIKQVIKAGGDVQGIKDTVNDISHMLTYKMELGEEFVVYSGAGTNMLAAVRMDLDGVLSGIVNYAPELVAKLVDNAASRLGFEAQLEANALSSLAKKYGQWSANYSLVRLIKGYDVGEPRPPVYPLTQREERQLARELEGLALKFVSFSRANSKTKAA